VFPTPRRRLRPPELGRVDGWPHPRPVWDALERFAQELNSCERSTPQIRLALDAIRQSLDADAVFWCSDAPGDGVERVGELELTPEWCRQFLRRMLAETPGVDGQLLRSSLSPTPGKLSPRSAALVRLSKSRSSWIAALRFRDEPLFGLVDMKVLSLARRMLLNQRRHSEVRGRLKETVSCLVRCLTEVIDARQQHTQGHSERVAQIAARLAQEMRLPVEAVSDVYFAGLLHDVGIVHLRDGVLLKPDALSDDELAHVRETPALGDRILARIKPLDHLRPAVRHCRERYDGNGYPDRLAGDDIPLMARILAVAEACDAMLSPRPHRPALTPARIEALLAAGAGTQWDPAVVETFLLCRSDLYPICGSGGSVAAAVERAFDATNLDSSHTVLHQGQPTVTAACWETLASPSDPRGAASEP
jgi:hypothetical protein